MIKIKGTRYADIKEFADIKQVTIQTVYNWIRDGVVETKTIMDKKFIKL